MNYKRIKTLTSYAAHARFLSECEADDEGLARTVGYISTPRAIDSPFAHSPTTTVMNHHGRYVFIKETKHRHYEVFELRPASDKSGLSLLTEEQAEQEYLASQN